MDHNDCRWRRKLSTKFSLNYNTVISEAEVLQTHANTGSQGADCLLCVLTIAVEIGHCHCTHVQGWKGVDESMTCWNIV